MAAVDRFPLLYREVARSCSDYFEALALVGALYAAGKTCVFVHRCCTFVGTHFLPRLTPTRKTLRRRYGAWAVISGASDDAPHAYAEELARQGINLLFVGHDGAINAHLATSLSQRYGVEAAAVEADWALGEAAVEALEGALGDKDVGILVNCASRCPVPPSHLGEMSERVLLDVLNRTVVAATLVTRLVLPGMAQRRRGAVVNMCFGAGGRAALVASEGFLEKFSQALHLEYGDKGIFIQTLTPLQVSSRGRPACSPLAVRGWLLPKPEVYARHALSTLGVSHHTTGYWPHTLQRGFISCIPQWIWSMGGQCC